LGVRERHGNFYGRIDCVTDKLAARFWPKVDRRGDDECWPWLGAKNERGYGMIAAPREPGSKRTTTLRAHRVAYELSTGEQIPRGREIDHRCHSQDSNCTLGNDCPHRACCNPAHFEITTRAENSARKRWRDYTHCPHGHEYTPENTKIGSRGERKCRECHRAQERARQAKKLAAQAGSES
jgi:hypothetical protein